MFEMPLRGEGFMVMSRVVSGCGEWLWWSVGRGVVGWSVVVCCGRSVMVWSAVVVWSVGRGVVRVGEG